MLLLPATTAYFFSNKSSIQIILHESCLHRWWLHVWLLTTCHRKACACMARPFIFLGSFALCVPRCVSNAVQSPLFPLSEVDKASKGESDPSMWRPPSLSPARTNIISQTTHTLAAKATLQIREQRLVSRLSIAVLCWSSVPTFSLSNNSPLICQSLHLDNSFPLIFFYFRLRRIFGVQTLLLNAYSTIVQSKYIKQQVVSIYSSAFPIFNFIKWQLSEHNRHSYPPLHCLIVVCIISDI